MKKTTTQRGALKRQAEREAAMLTFDEACEWATEEAAERVMTVGEEAGLTFFALLKYMAEEEDYSNRAAVYQSAAGGAVMLLGDADSFLNTRIARQIKRVRALEAARQ
ncbi:MAG TPA: hypothetical protein VIP46_22605 [Pyrinomonadaceae bacterium]